MLRNDSFYLKRIADIPYILPVGQMVADHKRGVKINETGAFIWECIKEDLSIEELNEKCFKHYEASDDEKDEIAAGTDEFIKLLDSLGMTAKDKDFEKPDIHITGTGGFVPYKNIDFIKSVGIANIKIGFYGEGECLTDKFDAFAIKSDGADDLRIEIVNETPESLSGKEIVINAAVETTECDDRYILRFPESEKIIECHLSKKGNFARFYTYKDFDEAEKELLFHAIRTVFLYKALLKGIVAIHSASILYKNSVWLFSAPSGTGKSTHAGLWKELFETEIVNGDLNLLGCKDGKPVVYGLPWCGTSNTFDVNTYKLGGVILLKRNQKNFVEDLPEDEKQLLVQQRIISPSWDAKALDMQFDIVENIIKNGAIVARLNCTADYEAAIVMKEYLDKKII
ncbi:MAG: PqqD family protein [Lachnospiraceae bacterium]|nr:PqqD family protein [Lachnospiraceae bacterium]